MDLTGAIDLHVHPAPDVMERTVDDLDLARAAEAAGMRAVMLKGHHVPTAGRAAIARRLVGIDVFGSITLNRAVGGLNPAAVETAVAMGAREVWMPTLDAAHHLDVMGGGDATGGLSTLDADGEPLPEGLAILEIIRDAGVILGTGHLAPAESLTLVKRAREMGVAKVFITHPTMVMSRFTPDQARAAVEMGAMLEFVYLSCCPNWEQAGKPADTAAMIRAVGCEHCTMASDGGQRFNPPPVQMLNDFADALHAEGIGEGELRRMMCDNPARMVGL